MSCWHARAAVARARSNEPGRCRFPDRRPAPQVASAWVAAPEPAFSIGDRVCATPARACRVRTCWRGQDGLDRRWRACPCHAADRATARFHAPWIANLRAGCAPGPHRQTTGHCHAGRRQKGPQASACLFLIRRPLPLVEKATRPPRAACPAAPECTPPSVASRSIRRRGA